LKEVKFVTLESVIKAHLDMIFPGMIIGDTM